LLALITSVTFGLSSTPVSGSGSHPEDGTVQKVVLVRADKLITRPGRALDGGAILIENGVVVAVGRGLEAPEGARVVQGKVACAGFIDAWSGFGLENNAFGDERIGAATAAADQIDSYLDGRFETHVLAAGVTAFRVQPSIGARAGGLGAVLRLHPKLRSDESMLLADSCVAGSIGLPRDGRAPDPFERVSEVDRWVGALSDGLSYLQDHNEYRHELQEWEQKIAEKQKELDEGFKKAKKEREKAQADAKEKGTEFKEKEYKEDKKPKAPRFDEDKEVMARVASGELPLVIEAHRAFELRNLLEATERFDRLRLVIAGGTEAATCAEKLKQRRIPVLVAPTPVAGVSEDQSTSANLGLAAALERAGVEVLLGTGGATGVGSRELPVLAALAIGHGLSEEAALAAITTRPARVFDVGDKVGSLEIGRQADVVVFSGEPFAATTRVQYVISNGEVVVGGQ
jgi:imidazolonepropionase-like amidohydrolase